jgi:hypothetical protein
LTPGFAELRSAGNDRRHRNLGPYDQLGFAAGVLHLDGVAAADDRRAGHGRVRHRLVARVVHRALPFADAAHDVREDPQLGRIELAVLFADRRRSDEVVGLDVVQRRGLVLDDDEVRRELERFDCAASVLTEIEAASNVLDRCPLPRSWSALARSRLRMKRGWREAEQHGAHGRFSSLLERNDLDKLILPPGAALDRDAERAQPNRFANQLDKLASPCRQRVAHLIRASQVPSGCPLERAHARVRLDLDPDEAGIA